MAGKLRVGIVGCGGMTRNHTWGYLNSGLYEIAGLADLSPEAMKDYDEVFGEQSDYDPKHYADFRQMLEEVGPDVVSVGAWHKGHAPLTIGAAARRPKAIICEKPMADSLRAAREMITACQRHGVKLVIGHQRRFLPAYTLARQMIEDGEIGDIRLISSVGGDGLPNYSSHQTDMYRYLLGDTDCEWVMGNVERQTDQWERDTQIEDRALAVFGFRNGTQAMLLSDLTSEHWQGARIYGSNGMIEITTEELRLMNSKSGGSWKLYQPDGEFFKFGADRFEWVEAGAGQARELAEWVGGQRESHRGEASHGYKALEMIHAVYESARVHERVELPMKTLDNPLELMIDSGHLPVRYPGRYDIRVNRLRGENMASDAVNR